ncbi:hypothetical protein ACHAXM_007199, partial [Skeletonema potamos]
TADPEAVDCSELLKTFRADGIEVAKKNSTQNFRRSFVTLADGDHLKPFYISTHDKEIDHVRSSIMKYGYYYEKDLTKQIRGTFDRLQREGKESIFLDVGANIGWFSLVAAAHGATKVYSFEPNLQNTIRFCESLTLNGWGAGDLVIPIAKGVGRVEENKTLYGSAGNKNPGAFSFSESRSGDAIGEMEITTLDAFAERHGWFESRTSIGVFKLDVEYFELEVMEGAEKLLRSRIIELIAMELKPDHTKDAKFKICKLLLDSGYELWMHGGWPGPREGVKTKYTNPSDLVEDFQAGKFKENVLFRLRDTRGRR